MDWNLTCLERFHYKVSQFHRNAKTMRIETLGLSDLIEVDFIYIYNIYAVIYIYIVVSVYFNLMMALHHRIHACGNTASILHDAFAPVLYIYRCAYIHEENFSSNSISNFSTFFYDFIHDILFQFIGKCLKHLQIKQFPLFLESEQFFFTYFFSIRYKVVQR